MLHASIVEIFESSTPSF